MFMRDASLRCQGNVLRKCVARRQVKGKGQGLGEVAATAAVKRWYVWADNLTDSLATFETL